MQYIIRYSIAINVGVSRGGRDLSYKRVWGRVYMYIYTCQNTKPSAHTPSNSFVNEISSPSTYTNTDGYTLSYYILRSFLR